MMMIVTIPSERPQPQVSKPLRGLKPGSLRFGLTEKGLNITRDRGPVVDDGERDLRFKSRRFQILRNAFS